ncbi:MAG: hypothetical protein Q8N83_05810 [Ignavibacteria bacterium]|nr:hypothetical protein [Ignavibacteria bacterium]
MKFSQRIGKTPATKKIQIDEIDADLRNGLWNTLKIYFIDEIEHCNPRYPPETNFSILCKVLWIDFFKLPIDTMPRNVEQQEAYLRNSFFEYNWFEVYDFLEFITNIYINTKITSREKFKRLCNQILERENSGYRFIDDKIAPITNITEINEIEEAIHNSGHFSALNGANIHLKNALDKLSDKKNPDYRNSIKESISAVESVAKTISDNKNDTLGGALDKIKDITKIHPALEKGFKQIYGYTSESNGIRHALMDEANCDFEDAKFMLVSCSAFINYLIAKADKAGIKIDK